MNGETEKTTWEKVKGFVFGGGAAVVFIMFLGFVDWRIGVKVDDALASLDIGTDAKIISMDTEIDTAQATANANTTRIDGNERRVEQAFAALMGRPITTDGD